MSDIFDDGPSPYEPAGRYGSASSSTDMFGEPTSSYSPSGESGGAELKVEHPPVVYLAVAAVLAVGAGVLYFVNNWKLSIAGYIAAVLVILASGWFQQRNQALRSRSRHYAPLLWTAKATASLIIVGFLAAIGNVTRIAHELATRYTLFCIAALLAISAAGAGLVIDAPPASAQVSAQTASTTEQVSSVYSGFLECVATGRTGLVQVIVDESASLSGPEGTDPTDQRVPALQSSLQSLDAARRNNGINAPIDVMLAGFGVDYEVRTDWTPLSGSTLPGLLQGVRTFADRDTAIDTDYFFALDGANESFADKSDEIVRSGDEAPCQMLFWITDGAYDINWRYNAGLADAYGSTKPYAPEKDLRIAEQAKAAVNEGESLICNPGGTIDSLRADGTSVIAVTLAAPGTTTDYRLVAAASTGSLRADGSKCGTREANGALISAQDPSKLLVSPGAQEISVPWDFSINALDASFTLDVRWPDSLGLNEVTLDDPTGESIGMRAPAAGHADDLKASESKLGPHDVSWTWLSDNWLHIETDVDQATGAGKWQTKFTGRTFSDNDVKPIVSMLALPGYRIDLGPVDELRPGERGSAEVLILGANGKPLGASVHEQLDLTLELQVGDETKSFEFPSTAKSDYTAEFEIPEKFEGDSIVLTAVATPKAEERANIPQTRTFKLDVAPPPGFPTIGKAKADNVTGTGVATINIPIIGSPSSAGEVCVTGGITSRPTDYAKGGVSLGSLPADCIAVPAGTTQDFTVDLNVNERGRGRVEGQFEFEIHSEQSADRVVTRTADFSMRIIPVADATTEWVLRILLILVGILIPLLIMYANKFAGARYVQSESLRRVTIPMVATADRTAPSTDWDDELGEDWLRGEKHAPPASSEFEFGRKIGLNPFTAGKATVAAPGSALVIGSAGTLTGRSAKANEPTGVIDFGLRSSWALRLHDPKFPDGIAIDDPHAMPDSATGELVAFITDREEFDQILDDVDFKATAEYATHDWSADLAPRADEIKETIDLTAPSAAAETTTESWQDFAMDPARGATADTASVPAAEEPDDPFNF